MSWDASLTDDRGHAEGDWNYTHNTSCMIYTVLAESRWKDEPPPWWKLLDGMTGAEGAEYLGTIIRGLEADPQKFRAMNPANGWGDYRGLLSVLREMHKKSLVEWPTTWSASG